MTDHGTYISYNKGCRCDECRTASTERTWVTRRQRREAGIVPETVSHGKASTYSNWGCRCEECKLAFRTENTRLAQLRRARRSSARQSDGAT